MKPWHTLFRNRDGGLCVVCCCLVLIVVVSVGTWAALDIYHRMQSDFPGGFVALISALSVVQGCKNWTDARFAPDGKGCPPPGP